MADCRSSRGDCMIDKYADDTVLTGQITDDDMMTPTTDRRFVRWFDQNHLELNVVNVDGIQKKQKCA